jgi:hypothetical protein
MVIMLSVQKRQYLPPEDGWARATSCRLAAVKCFDNYRLVSPTFAWFRLLSPTFGLTFLKNHAMRPKAANFA